MKRIPNQDRKTCPLQQLQLPDKVAWLMLNFFDFLEQYLSCLNGAVFLDDFGELGAVDVSGDVPNIEPPGGGVLRRRRGRRRRSGGGGGFFRNGTRANSLQAQSTRGGGGGGGFERKREGEGGLEVEDWDGELLRSGRP